MKSLPELAIVGVPKAGTTSLHCWLETLTQINAANPKETFFFMDDGNPMANPTNNLRKPNSEGYSAFFAQASNGLTLDSTTHHLYQDAAIEKFSAGHTKVLVILRDPVKRLVSYFNYVKVVRGAISSNLTFSEFVEESIDNQLASRRGDFSNESDWYSMSTALRQGEYAYFIEKWLDAIPHERFKVMFFEDLIDYQQLFLQQMAEYFGVEATDADFDRFQVFNEGNAPRFPSFNRNLRKMSGLLRQMPFFDLLRRSYHKVQSGEKIQFDWATNRECLERLEEYYKPPNRQLASVLGGDLPAWLCAPEKSHSE